MDIEGLNQELDNKIENIAPELKVQIEAALKEHLPVYPFNDVELKFMFLLNHRVLTYDEYKYLRKTYVDANQNLYLFELGPRVFGQVWGENHLCEIDSRFQKATKNMDHSFSGEYDLILGDHRIEVKAGRATDSSKKGSLVSKALRNSSNAPFWMNFQQLKFDICDVFVFIGVWVDTIKYWVMSHNEVKENRYLSPQHRGGIEFQIGIKDTNIDEFSRYLVTANELASKVADKV